MERRHELVGIGHPGCEVRRFRQNEHGIYVPEFLCSGMLMGGFYSQGAGGGSDVVDIIATSANENTSGALASARITAYHTGTRQGEVWADFDGVPIKINDFVLPNASATNYQMRWQTLSGDAPNLNSVAANTWQSLAAADFYVEWRVTTNGTRSGSVTVSIREGTGSVLDSAIWDGDASLSGKGK